MAGDVESQRDLNTYHLGNLFQVVVDVVAHVAVSASLVGAWIPDDGEQIVGGVFRGLVEYHLHFLSPFDDKLLACLAAAIGDIAVFEVGLSQKRHVDEAHSPEIETHKEHVTGEVKRWSQGKVQRLDLLYQYQRQCSLHSLVNAGIYMAERIAVLDDVIFDRSVIDRPEYAGVE